MSESPEVRLSLGCAAVGGLGGFCYAALLWQLRSFLVGREVDEETLGGVFMLAVFMAPAIIPVAGFVVLTLLRICWRLFRDKLGLSTVTPPD